MAGNRKPWEVYEAEFEKSGVRRADYPAPPLPALAFAGRSNCGKSSLLNCLVRRKHLAKTSSTPGHTQLINFFRINERWRYVDLPGYGFAKAPRAEQEKWRRMIEEYLSSAAELRLLVLLLDCRRGPTELDDRLVEYAESIQLPLGLVLTKSDKLKKNALIKVQRQVAEHYGLDPQTPPPALSAKTGRGRETLLQLFYDVLEAELEAP